MIFEVIIHGAALAAAVAAGLAFGASLWGVVFAVRIITGSERP